MRAFRRARRKYQRARTSVRCAWQRLRHGWDVTAIWATDGWLTKHLGQVLLATAEELHGYPDGIPFETWQEQHRAAGRALLNYADKQYDVYGEEFEKLHREAKAALYWVADNLPALWD